LIVASVACLEISFDDVDRLHLGRLGAGRLKIKDGRDQQTENRSTGEKNRWTRNVGLGLNHF
jgi:hypothetical protein